MIDQKGKGESSPSGRIGLAISGSSHVIGEGFSAKRLSEEMFDGRMDPLLMVDHFVMTAPTFAPHLHAGISAVTAMFEDSSGTFINRDTLGNSVELMPGDLYWLAAARGAAHQEEPTAGSRTHALQMFVNLPARLKKEPARVFHVKAGDIPLIERQGYRVRVVLGQSGETIGADGPPEEMTMLDGFLEADGQFSHALPADWQAWIYSVDGDLTIRVNDEESILLSGRATTISAGPETDIVIQADAAAHFVIVAGTAIRESFVKAGPLVMSSMEDVRQTRADYEAGRFGRIPE